jgi:hypothetical protein
MFVPCLEGALQSFQDNPGGQIRGTEKPLGTGEGREGLGQALAIGLVAGYAGKIDLLSALGAGGEGGLWWRGTRSGRGLGEPFGQGGVRLQGKEPVREHLWMLPNSLQGILDNPAEEVLKFPFLFFFKEGTEKSFRVTDDGEADSIRKVIVPSNSRVRGDEVKEILTKPCTGRGFHEAEGRGLAFQQVSSGILEALETHGRRVDDGLVPARSLLV